MTKRDSVTAGFTFPPMSMNTPRRPSRAARHAGHSSEWQDSHAAASSYTSHPEFSSGHTSHHSAYGDQSHPSEYEVPSIPIPTSAPSGHQAPIIPSRDTNSQGEHPLQHQFAENHRQLHAHYFVEVSIPGNDQNLPANRYMMVTELDQHGIHRNRQPEYFFNGIVGHIRACRNGWIDSWTQSNQLANYWRRYFNIPEIAQSRSTTRWENDGHDSPTHQLATLLWNILNNDREANQAILERLEDTEGDLLRHPVQIFSAADLAHLASHLAETTRTLANQAYEMEAMSDLSE